MKAIWADFISLQGRPFALEERAPVMKNGISAVACDHEALYFLVQRDYEIALQMTEETTAAWIFEHGSWKPADCERFPLAYLVKPELKAELIAQAIARIIDSTCRSVQMDTHHMKGADGYA